MLELDQGSRLHKSGGRAIGPHGYGTANDAEKEVFAFLTAHQATVCNTWFRRKKIHMAAPEIKSVVLSLHCDEAERLKIL